uniref:Ribosome biogenesis protein WDR12 homolog n=1 Tax=Lactuca sativa TaxID=4236 RepID=A0A9R1XFW4_LACSA|nr:hypothetical protein LSAT_V11C500278190 [Lactuca sativa]
MVKIEAFLPENGEKSKIFLDLLIFSCISEASPSSSSSKALKNAHKWLTSSWKAPGFPSGLEKALRRVRECYRIEFREGASERLQSIAASATPQAHPCLPPLAISSPEIVAAHSNTGAMDIDGDVEDVSRRVQVRFVTKLKPPFKAPTTTIALPSTLTRKGLSSVVNSLLQSGNDDWKHEPFDFLIDGELVRMSLEDFLLAKGISAEKTLEIEYIKAVAPRKEEDPSLHDDWVNAVDGSNQFILTGCYDGLGRIWKGPGNCTHILEGHNGVITSVGVVNSKDNENDTNKVVATGSKDRTVKLWKFDPEPLSENLKISSFRTLVGHTASVQSLASQPNGNLICSGSWDCRINVWQTESNEADIVSVKKRKKGNKQEESQSEVRFVTKLKPPFKAPTTTIALPSTLTRKGLSSVVNSLLQSGNDDWKHEPFDFLIDGELVRMSLEDFLLAKGISAEKTLEIEYIKAVAPRKEEDPSLHDDWVSAVDGSNQFILTGCYDGLGRIWKGPENCTHILEGHNGAITSVGVVNSKDNENDTNKVVATGSKDRTVKLWKFDPEPLSENLKISSFRTLVGHTASVQSLASQPNGNLICSGSWDCRINVWQTESNEADIVSVKKRKKGNKQEESQSEGEAVATLVGHTQCVSSVVWPEYGTIYSASWDHSIRRWDIETGKDTINMFCGKVVNCIDIGGESSALIAGGCSDPTLRIWDPRKPGTLAPSFQFSSHTSWITACKWHKTSWFHLLSSSYDGKVMLWDLRTAWPLAIIDSHEDKVLCADWWNGDSVCLYLKIEEMKWRCD